MAWGEVAMIAFVCVMAIHMELIDAMAASQGEDPTQISVVIAKILGNDQKKKLYDHVRAEDGRVPVSKVADIITEIINAIGDDGKN